MGHLIAPRSQPLCLRLPQWKKGLRPWALGLGKRVLIVVCVCVPNGSSEYPPFLESLKQVLRSAINEDSMVILGDLNAHVPNESKNPRDVIGRNGLPNLKLSGVRLLDFCANHSLSITNTMFSHKSVRKCIWHQDTLG